MASASDTLSRPPQHKAVYSAQSWSPAARNLPMNANAISRDIGVADVGGLIAFHAFTILSVRYSFCLISGCAMSV